MSTGGNPLPAQHAQDSVKSLPVVGQQLAVISTTHLLGQRAVHGQSLCTKYDSLWVNFTFEIPDLMWKPMRIYSDLETRLTLFMSSDRRSLGWAVSQSRVTSTVFKTGKNCESRLFSSWPAKKNKTKWKKNAKRTCILLHPLHFCEKNVQTPSNTDLN